MGRYEAIPASELCPGDRLARYADGSQPHTVVEGPEPADDPFGRPGHIRVLCAMDDGTRTGYRCFGPTGTAFRAN